MSPANFPVEYVLWIFLAVVLMWVMGNGSY